MLTLYEKYRKTCFNSIVNEGDISTQEMEAALSLWTRNRAIRDVLNIPEPSLERIEVYEKWKESRRVNSFCDFNESEKAEICAAVDMYADTFGGIRKVWVSGSYASGSWMNEHCSEEDRRIRRIKKRDRHISDIDLITEPRYESMEINNVDFISFEKENKVLIYENGKFLCF